MTSVGEVATTEYGRLLGVVYVIGHTLVLLCLRRALRRRIAACSLRTLCPKVARALSSRTSLQTYSFTLCIFSEAISSFTKRSKDTHNFKSNRKSVACSPLPRVEV